MCRLFDFVDILGDMIDIVDIRIFLMALDDGSP